MDTAKRQAPSGGLINRFETKANMPLSCTLHRAFKHRHLPAQGFNPIHLGCLLHTLQSNMFLFCSIIESKDPLVNHLENSQK